MALTGLAALSPAAAALYSYHEAADITDRLLVCLNSTVRKGFSNLVDSRVSMNIRRRNRPASCLYLYPRDDHSYVAAMYSFWDRAATISGRRNGMFNEGIPYRGLMSGETQLREQHAILRLDGVRVLYSI